MRDMTFSRAPVACIGCHRGDYDATALRSFDHVAARLDVNCQTCHNTWRFSPARFDAHDFCFILSSGPHRPIRCTQCHSSVVSVPVTGTCTSWHLPLHQLPHARLRAQRSTPRQRDGLQLHRPEVFRVPSEDTAVTRAARRFTVAARALALAAAMFASVWTATGPSTRRRAGTDRMGPVRHREARLSRPRSCRRPGHTTDRQVAARRGQVRQLPDRDPGGARRRLPR